MDAYAQGKEEEGVECSFILSCFIWGRAEEVGREEGVDLCEVLVRIFDGVDTPPFFF